MDGAAKARLGQLRSWLAVLSSSSDTGTSLPVARCAAIAAVLQQQLVLAEPPADTITQSTVWAEVTQVVQQWFQALVQQISRPQVGARLAGYLLLAPSMQSCGATTLVGGFSRWGAALLEGLKKEVAAADVGACFAACTTLATLFSRIHEVIDVPGVRRDAASFATKAWQLVSTCLSDPACTFKPAVLQLLSSIQRAVPTSIRGQAPAIEKLLADTLSHSDSPCALKCEAAVCLAQLPRSYAEPAEAWSNLMRRLLVSVHALLDVIFQGLDDQTLAGRAKELHTTDTEAPPALLAQLPSAAGSTRSLTAPLDTLAACVVCLETLQTSPQPLPVPVPAHALLLLVMRMLKFDDGAVLASGRTLPSASLFVELSSRREAIQSTGWQLLALLVRVGRTLLLPLQGLACRLMQEHLRRIAAHSSPASLPASPATRVHLYAAATTWVQALGLSAGLSLAQDLLSAATLELYGLNLLSGSNSGLSFSGGKTAAAPSADGPKSKKARLNDVSDVTPLELLAASGQALPALLQPADVVVQVAVLQAMQTVLETAGPCLQPQLRSSYDATAAHLALTCMHAAQSCSHNPNSAAMSAIKTLQLHTYKLLLASILAPVPHRPVFLEHALRLFQSGRSDSNPSIQHLCTQACLSVEALLHPRALPTSSAQDHATASVPHLPRPRMWSLLDPVPSQPVASATHPAAQNGPQTTAPQSAAHPLAAGPLHIQPSPQVSWPQSLTSPQPAPIQHGVQTSASFLPPISAADTANAVAPSISPRTAIHSPAALDVAKPAISHAHAVAPSSTFHQQSLPQQQLPVQDHVHSTPVVPQAAAAQFGAPIHQNSSMPAASPSVRLQAGEPVQATAVQAAQQPAPSALVSQQQASQRVQSSNAAAAPAVPSKPSSAFALGGESSDSEGPLPEIDSGMSDSDEEDNA